MRFPRYLLLFITAAVVVPQVPVAAQPRPRPAFLVGGGELDYIELTNRVTFNQSNFFVYLDQDSGFNHGFPSGLFGDLTAIAIDAGCIDNPSDTTTGCYSSTSTTALDTARGTVLRVSFAPLSSGDFAGLNIEEPQNWGTLQTGLGYDLTGASNIVFDVRSPQAAAFQFGVGPCVTGFITVPQTWTTMTIPLSSLTPGASGATCPPDLTSVHILFSVTTNDVHNPVTGSTVLLDNIQFTPTPARTSQGAETLSLPLSTQTFGVVPQTSNFPPDQVNRNPASIYESALTIISLLNRGQSGDLTNAQAIADTFDYALHHDNHGDPLPVAPDGSVGLHNAYESGDIALLNDQQSPALGQAGDVRLAGFSVPTSPPGFDLVLDGATGGNNAFAILAFGAAYLQFGDTAYLNDAITIGNWIIGNLKDTTGTGYGGYFLGYPDMGVPPPKPLTHSKSTENNADIFAAFSLLSALDSTNTGNWTTAANVAGDFVMAMFDSSTGRFFAGTYPQSSGYGFGSDIINTSDFLDANTFATLALSDAPRYITKIDWTKPIQYVFNTFAQTVTAGGITYQGFDLVPTPVSGNNGIAWEFTGQAVETWAYLDALTTTTDFQSCAQTYNAQIAHAQYNQSEPPLPGTTAPFGDGMGLVASTLDSENSPPANLPPADECLNTPYQCIPERVGLAATNWDVFSGFGVNPFPQFAATVSAASGTAPVAAESIVSIYGVTLANGTTIASTQPLPTSLNNVSVTITDSTGVRAAVPLFYTSPSQINAEIPPGLADGLAQLVVTSPFANSISPVTLAAVAPSIFTSNETGKGVPAAQLVTNLPSGAQTITNIFQCPNGVGSCVPVPIDLSVGTSALVLYGTGIRNRAALSDVTVQIGAQTLPAGYAGLTAGYTGLDQVNVLLPATLAGSGTVNVQVLIAGTASNTVMVAFQ